jgi:REP element-mobilizing transposase RayT
MQMAMKICFLSLKIIVIFLKQYNRYVEAIADTYCYCLMPNHFHFLIRIKIKVAITSHLPGFENLEGVALSNCLSKKFSNFFNRYTKAFNQKYERRGSLFLKNFKKKATLKINYLSSRILYIHLNTVKHGFVLNPKDWKWSTFHNFPIDHVNLVTSLFGNEEKYFQDYDEKIKSFNEYDIIDNYFLN